MFFFNSVKFANDKVGLAIGDPIEGKPFLLKTIDGGKNWKRIFKIPESQSGEANFAASNTCIEFLPSGKAWIATGGDVARVFYSVDFGETWEVTETLIIHGNSSSGIFSIAFLNDNQGVIVGGTYNNPELNEKIAAFTNDGGKHWILAEMMPKEYRSCVQSVQYEGGYFFFSLGKTGSDYSLNDGNKWITLSEKGYYTFRSIPGKPVGFAAGKEGEIVKLDFSIPKE